MLFQEKKESACGNSESSINHVNNMRDLVKKMLKVAFILMNKVL